MNAKGVAWEKRGVIVLLLVWISIWGAWVPARTIILTQNALHLAEWSTILPESRFEGMAYLSELLRLAVALAVVALAVYVGVLRSALARWLIRLVACLPGLVVLPPYPELLNLWWSAAYGNRFGVAAALFAGVLASALTDLLPIKLRRWLVSVLSLVAAGLAIWAFFSLRVLFEVRYTGILMPGWGFGVFVGGLIVMGVAQITDLIYRSSQPATHNQPASIIESSPH